MSADFSFNAIASEVGQESLTFNIAIVGAHGVGKSTYVERHLTGEFVKQYNAFDNITATIEYNTNMGYVYTHTCTSATPDIITDDTDAVMVMFDVTNRLTYKYAISVLESVLLNHPGLPVVLVGNKVDVRTRQVQAKDIKDWSKRVQYYDFSAKSNYNFDRPILHLLRTNLGMSNLQFVEEEPIEPPCIEITKEIFREMDKVWNEIAVDIPLPVEDDVIEFDVEMDAESDEEVEFVENRSMDVLQEQGHMRTTLRSVGMRCRL